MQVDNETTSETLKIKPDAPTVLVVMGMAGSGKTTFVHRLISFLNQAGKRTYNINLDPAVLEVNFPCNIDIRDSVKYKNVMKNYGLGPNGAIITSLNLFAAQFDQVVNMINSKPNLDFVIVDTPGQIEVFSQSASGQIITQALASMFPTINLYITDTVRCTNPNTFISNMLYSLSILYKSKIPLCVVFNKIDVQDCKFVQDWMIDYDKFDEALAKEENYLASFSRSMSLVLDEFYQLVPNCGVSATQGLGFDLMMPQIEKLRKEYFEVFLPELNQ